MAISTASPAFERLMRTSHILSAMAPAVPLPELLPAAGGAEVDRPAFIVTLHLENIRRLLATHFGFQVRDEWMNSLVTQVRGRMAVYHLTRTQDYYHRLVYNSEERQHLIESLLNHETHFHRTAPHFEALMNVVVPDWRTRGRDRLRLCSLGCATGEEPYSLAMWLGEHLPASEIERTEITGFDLSQTALARARGGRYGEFQLRELEPHRRARWFNQARDHWQVKPELSRRVRFVQHNLLAPLPCAGVDVIFCRNVLIYFSKPEVARIMHELHAALNPGGWLFLGHAESALDYSELFRPLCAPETVIYQRAAAAPR